jgi:hypothetical protein
VIIIDELLSTDVRDKAIPAQPGAITTIKAFPSHMMASKAFLDLDQTTRGCKTLQETSKGSIFKYYTKQTCSFECRVRHSLEICGCTPWQYPQYGETITEICDGVQVLQLNHVFVLLYSLFY